MISIVALLAAPAPALPAGLEQVDCGGVVAVVRRVTAPPRVDVTALAAQDALVRQLWRDEAAVLPVRFGQVVEDATQLRAGIQPRAETFQAALREVDGAAQMTLRVWGEDPAALGEAEVPAPPATGPGGRYLAARVQAARAAREVPVLATLEARVTGLVRARRVKRGGRAGLLASVYHLVTQVDEYRAVVNDEIEQVRGVRVTVAGPGPAYAFAPEEP